jgi:hypothetical protein
MAGSFMAAARELASYILHFLRVQQVRWVKSGTLRLWDFSFVYGKDFCTPQNSISNQDSRVFLTIGCNT